MTTPLVIPVTEVKDLLLNSGISFWPLAMANSFYTPLDEDWIEGALHECWVDNLFSMGLTSPEPQDGECDTYALWLMALATELHRRTLERPYPRAALAIGEMWLTLAGGKDHAMNVCVTAQAGELHVRALEPQPNAYGLKTLTQDELDSIQFFRM